jgi:tetratricopeptide (TPR) repeat protein
MRRLAAIPVLVVVSACSASRRPVVAPQPSAAERLAAVDAEVRAGCLDCLIDAYKRFEELRKDPSTAEGATEGAIRAAALVAVRQRELGMVDDGFLAIARRLAGEHPAVPSWLPKILDIVDGLPQNGAGVAGPPRTDADLDRMRRMRGNRDAWMALLRDAARFDEAAAYTLLSFACGSIDTRDIRREELFANVEAFAGAPLIVYRESLCRGIETTTLEPLLAKDARFVEIAYSLGLANQASRPRPKLDEAEQFYQQAYTWHRQWPSLTLTMAGVAMTAEDFDRARTMYEETLAYEPHSVDALLGIAKALTYLGKYEDAIAAADRVIAERWYVGDALYWRAYDEMQLMRYDQAWSDVEESGKLLIDAEVPKLAGLIAYQRHQLDVSISRFMTSQERNPFDCETRFYLGVVHAELRHWSDTANVLGSTAECLQRAEEGLVEDIERIRASNLREDRKARQIAKREQQIAEGRRRIATSWYDCAVAYFGLSKKDEARLFAEKVADDEQFGARAKDILSRLK